MDKLVPYTREQEYLEAILAEQKRIRELLEKLVNGNGAEVSESEVVCDVCGKGFRNERALRAHKRVH